MICILSARIDKENRNRSIVHFSVLCDKAPVHTNGGFEIVEKLCVSDNPCFDFAEHGRPKTEVHAARLALYSSASSRTAETAASASSSVLKKEKLNRTAPCCTVPSASCIRGAQCAPARVAMP